MPLNRRSAAKDCCPSRRIRPWPSSLPPRWCTESRETLTSASCRVASTERRRSRCVSVAVALWIVPPSRASTRPSSAVRASFPCRPSRLRRETSSPSSAPADEKRISPRAAPALPRSAASSVTCSACSATRNCPLAETSGNRSCISVPGNALRSSKPPASIASGDGCRTATRSIALAGAPSNNRARSTPFQRASSVSIFCDSNRRRLARPATAWARSVPVTGNSMRSSPPARVASSCPSTGRSAIVQASAPSMGKSDFVPMRSRPTMGPQGERTLKCPTSCRLRPPR